MNDNTSLPTDDTNRALPPRMLDAALSYAHRGWHVFPVHGVVEGRCSCGTLACPNAGKHPRIRHGVHEATTDEAAIRQRWTRWPATNIGVACGGKSGLVVLDIDPRHRGDASLEEWKTRYGHGFLNTVTSCTGGGGVHLFYAYPEQSVRNKVDIESGLDFRSDGGYIVAPPSLHTSGRRYAWDPAGNPDSRPLAPMPDWLITLVTAPATPRGLLLSPGEPAPRIPEGHRNATLTRMAGVMRRYGFIPDAIAGALLLINEAQCDPPLDETEVCRIAHSIGRYLPGASLIPQPLVRERQDIEHLTDLGNARRLVRYHGPDLHYCYPWRQWLVWNGTRWHPDDTGEILRRAKNTVERIYLEALQVSDTAMQKGLLHHATGSEAARRLYDMINLAASEPGIPILPGQLDTDPWLLNVRNGVIDLRSGELRAPRRDDLITKLAPVQYDPEAVCPQWISFLQQIMGGNESLTDFLPRAVGYALTGQTFEQVLFILYGIGANGKSTFLEVVRALCGDYARQAEFTTFLERKSDTVRNDLARLAGARFVTAVEATSGRRLDEAVVKQLTGGDAITARFFYKEHFEFTPQFKLFLATNHKPVIRGTEHAIWRRIRLIPFEVTIPPEQQDRALSTKLQAELPGILTWAVQGCLAWQREGGLAMPPEVLLATQTYREEMDLFGQFLADCCLLGPRRRATTEELYQAYGLWCTQNGIHYQPTKPQFGRWLGERGFTHSPRQGNKQSWAGVALFSAALETLQDQLRAQAPTPPSPTE
jgi:putative DNA primase/helicase